MEQTPARGWHETAPQQDWLAATTPAHARTRVESQHGMTINANLPQPWSCERRWPNSCSCGVPWLLQRSCAQIPKAVTQPPHPAPVGNSLCQPRFPGFRANSGQDTSQHCEGRTARVVRSVGAPALCWGFASTSYIYREHRFDIHGRAPVVRCIQLAQGTTQGIPWVAWQR